jgi:hypothetical protein
MARARINEGGYHDEFSGSTVLDNSGSIEWVTFLHGQRVYYDEMRLSIANFCSA